MADLRTAVVLDYQNTHLTGYSFYRGVFNPRRALHETVLDPSRFADQLLAARNRSEPGADRAVLARIEVFRGLPSNRRDPFLYSMVQRQAATWRRDPRVTMHLRPMRYLRSPLPSGFVADAKGVDVLVALHLLR